MKTISVGVIGAIFIHVRWQVGAQQVARDGKRR
jgi:hypothetical protein